MSTNRQPDSKPTVRENGIFRGALKSFVVVLVTGFVLFTLFVNAPTMRILMHLVGIDKLEPADLAIRNRVMASSLANIGDSVREFASAAIWIRRLPVRFWDTMSSALGCRRVDQRSWRTES